MLSQTHVDRCFRALAERNRRIIVERLSKSPATISEMARPLHLTVAAVVQHIQVLEECGLVTTGKSGRSRICRLDPRGLDGISTWIAARWSLIERQLMR